MNNLYKNDTSDAIMAIIVIIFVAISTFFITSKFVTDHYENKYLILTTQYRQAQRDISKLEREKEEYRHKYQQLIINNKLE